MSNFGLNFMVSKTMGSSVSRPQIKVASEQDNG